jgi:hypothetical protein
MSIGDVTAYVKHASQDPAYYAGLAEVMRSNPLTTKDQFDEFVRASREEYNTLRDRAAQIVSRPGTGTVHQQTILGELAPIHSRMLQIATEVGLPVAPVIGSLPRTDGRASDKDVLNILSSGVFVPQGATRYGLQDLTTTVEQVLQAAGHTEVHPGTAEFQRQVTIALLQGAQKVRYVANPNP